MMGPWAFRGTFGKNDVYFKIKRLKMFLLAGRQHSGLLQHDGGHNAPAAVEGAWWAKEVKGLVVVGKERYVIL